jgi:hypothetical protein
MKTTHLVATASFALALALLKTGTVHGDGGDTTLIHACVAKDGIMRIVSPTTTCKSSETPLHWATLARVGAIESKNGVQDSSITALQSSLGAIESKNAAQDSSITTHTGQISSLQSQINAVATSLQDQINDQASELAALESIPTAITAYTNRQTFIGAAGTTTNIDFSQLPDGQQNYQSLTISGATFYNFGAFSFPPTSLIMTGGGLKVDLPPNTRAVGVNFGTAYGDPGIGIMSLPTGHEFVSPSVNGFVGVVSDTPIPSVKFRFHSSCLPTHIYGTPTCPTFPTVGSPLGLATYDDFIFGSGPGN